MDFNETFFKKMLTKKSSYVRKTRDEYTIQTNYGYGYEDTTVEETHREGRQQLKVYRTEQPQYAHRLITKRVKI